MACTLRRSSSVSSTPPGVFSAAVGFDAVLGAAAAAATAASCFAPTPVGGRGAAGLGKPGAPAACLPAVFGAVASTPVVVVAAVLTAGPCTAGSSLTCICTAGDMLAATGPVLGPGVRAFMGPGADRLDSGSALMVAVAAPGRGRRCRLEKWVQGFRQGDTGQSGSCKDWFSSSTGT